VTKYTPDDLAAFLAKEAAGVGAAAAA